MLDDHERFMRKNQMMADGYANERVQSSVKKRMGEKEEYKREMSCFNCKKKSKCVEFKNKSTGGSGGAVSVDNTTTFLCDKYDPIPINKKDKGLTGKQVNNMLKAAKKGLL